MREQWPQRGQAAAFWMWALRHGRQDQGWRVSSAQLGQPGQCERRIVSPASLRVRCCCCWCCCCSTPCCAKAHHAQAVAQRCCHHSHAQQQQQQPPHLSHSTSAALGLSLKWLMKKSLKSQLVAVLKALAWIQALKKGSKAAEPPTSSCGAGAGGGVAECELHGLASIHTQAPGVTNGQCTGLCGVRVAREGVAGCSRHCQRFGRTPAAAVMKPAA